MTTDIPELKDFAQGLRDLKAKTDLSYRDLGQRIGRNASVLSRATSGNSLPTLDVTLRLVGACGGDQEEWQERWTHVRDRLEGHRSGATVTGDSDAPKNAAAFNTRLRHAIEGSESSVRAFADKIHTSHSTLSYSLASCVVVDEKLLCAILEQLGTTPKKTEQWLTWRRSLTTEYPWVPSVHLGVPAHLPPPPQPRRARVSATTRSGAIVIALIGVLTALIFWHPFGSPSRESRQPALNRSGLATTSGSVPREKPTPRSNGPAVKETPHGRSDTTATLPPQRVTAKAAPRLLLPADIPIKLVRPVEPVVTLADPDANRSGLPSLEPGQTTSIQCQSVTGGSHGWYYTHEGYFVQRRDFDFVEGSGAPVPPCNKVNFPENERPDADAPCVWMIRRSLHVRPCTARKELARPTSALRAPLTNLPEPLPAGCAPDECGTLDDSSPSAPRMPGSAPTPAPPSTSGTPR